MSYVEYVTEIPLLKKRHTKENDLLVPFSLEELDYDYREYFVVKDKFDFLHLIR